MKEPTVLSIGADTFGASTAYLCELFFSCEDESREKGLQQKQYLIFYHTLRPVTAESERPVKSRILYVQSCVYNVSNIVSFN